MRLHHPSVSRVITCCRYYARFDLDGVPRRSSPNRAAALPWYLSGSSASASASWSAAPFWPWPWPPVEVAPLSPPQPVGDKMPAMSGWFVYLLFYVLATFKVKPDGYRIVTVHTHGDWLHSAAPLENKTTRIMIWYPTQLYYSDTESTNPCPILIMLSTWLGNDKYEF